MLLFDFDQVLVDTEPISYLRRARNWAAYRKEVTRLQPCAGINELIRMAARLGHKMAIVTQSPTFVPRIFVEQQRWSIDIVVGWRDYRRRKPNPLCLQVAMQRGNAQPMDCYHVGDLPSDTEASRNAGMQSIGAGWAAVNPAALRRSRPDYYFETVGQLHAFIATLQVAG